MAPLSTADVVKSYSLNPRIQVRLAPARAAMMQSKLGRREGAPCVCFHVHRVGPAPYGKHMAA